VLVDVGVDRDHGQSLACQVADEQGRQRGLAAASLAGERDSHQILPRLKTVSM